MAPRGYPPEFWRRVVELVEGKRACTLYMSPSNAEGNGFRDGQMVPVITEAGRESIEVEVTEATRPG